jgi:outer membrane protein assembly factor BamB
VSVHPVRPDPKGITVRLREDSDELYFIYSGADRGVIMAFDAATGKFLWQRVHDKLPSGIVSHTLVTSVVRARSN